MTTQDNSIQDTIARLKELEKAKGPNNVRYYVAEKLKALPVLLDYIDAQAATIAKHERREDEHCRQIEELERKNALLLDVAKVGTKYFKPNQEFRFLDFENALKAAKDGGAMEEDK